MIAVGCHVSAGDQSQILCMSSQQALLTAEPPLQPLARDIFLLDMYSFLFGPYLYRNRIAGTYNNSNFWGNANFFQQLYHLIHSSMGSKYYSFSISLFITFFNIMSISLFLHYTKDLLRASSIQEIEAGKTGGRGQPGLHIKTLSQEKIISYLS